MAASFINNPRSAVPNHSGYYCSRCKGRHAKKETIRQCWVDYYAAKGQVLPQDMPTEVAKALNVEAAAVWSVINPVNGLPSGNYLVMVTMPSGLQKSVHIRIGVINSGKWDGAYFVSMFNDKTNKLESIKSQADRVAVVEKLKSGNWQRHMCEYGRAFGECPICGGKLGANEIRNGVHRSSDCWTKVYG